ncbi:tetratricopeptide repeat protein [Halapricum salinum]|uniref:Tetratricopeptide repeat protein n=1 Tax=Halapricum salinum TaxID=1457250 RepID=A0A4D6HBS5_9EURY|nr:tetratricopeptide repeat protein [Halapricum salinum]QCC51453.1 tetratricopeptide repeat protein [Halapricum salinum]
MLGSLAVALASAGLERGAEKGVKKYREKLVEEKFSGDIEALGTEFNQTLQKSIQREIDYSQFPELEVITDDWTPVAEELDDIDEVMFEDEADAVEEIVGAIERAHRIDPAQHPDLHRQLMQAVSESYAQAIHTFQNRIAGTDRATLLGYRSMDNLRDQVSEVDAEIERIQARLERTKYYHLFDGDRRGKERAVRVLADGLPEIDYFDREGVPPIAPSDRVLITGPKGVGKTRTLIEFIRQSSDVDQIVIPRPSLTDTSELDVLVDESFEGHIMFVWDDVHGVDPTTNNRVVRDAVLKLDDQLKDTKTSLSIFITARSEQLRKMPGDVNDPEGFWREFEQIQLQQFQDNAALGEFRMHVKESLDIEVDSSQSIGYTSATPLSIVRKFQELQSDDDDGVTAADIDIWSYHYQNLRDRDPQQTAVLDAIRILSDLGIAPTVPLIEGIYREVFCYDNPGDRLEPHLEALEQAGWIQRGEPLVQWEVPPPENIEKFHISSAVLAAIPEPVNSIYEPLAAFAIESLGNYVSSTELRKTEVDARWRWKAQISYLSAVRIKFLEYLVGGPPQKRISSHHRMSDYLSESNAQKPRKHYRFDPNDKRLESYVTPISDHSQEELELIRDCLDAFVEQADTTQIAQTIAARYLMQLGEVKDAKLKLESVIESAETPPTVSQAYLGVIHLLQNNLEIASQHLAEVIGSYHSPIDPDTPFNPDPEWGLDEDVVIEYAVLLARSKRWEPALDKFEYIDRWAGLDHALTAKDFVYWGEALLKTGDQETAQEKFKRALERDPEHVRAYVELGRLAQSKGEIEDAIRQFQQALEYSEDNSYAALQLGNLYRKKGNLSRARESYITAGKTTDEAAPFIRLASLEIEDDNPNGAVDAYEKAITRRPEDIELRMTQLRILFEGIPVDSDHLEGETWAIPSVDQNLKKNHLEFLLDHFTTEFPDFEFDEEGMRQNVREVISWYIQAPLSEPWMNGPHQATNDLLRKIPKDKPTLQGHALKTYGELVISADAKPLLLQMLAYRSLINRRYETGAYLLESLVEYRTQLDSSHDLWQNIVDGAVHIVCLARLGFSTIDSEELLDWIAKQSHDPSDEPYQGLKYLQEGNVDYRPGDLRYHAESTSRNIDFVPTPDDLKSTPLLTLEQLASATVVEELMKSQEDSPFESDPESPLEERPDSDAICTLYQVDGIGREIGFRLRTAGVQSVKDLQHLTPKQLQEVKGIGANSAVQIKNNAASLIEDT